MQMEAGRIDGVIQQIRRLALLECIPGDDTGALQLVCNTVGLEAVVHGDAMIFSSVSASENARP